MSNVRFGLVSIALVGLVAGACGGGPIAAPTARAPEYSPRDESKCTVVKSHAEPLVVEWPMSDRAKLETLKKSGLVVVAYEGCRMRLLPYCKVPGAYGYSSVTRKRDHIAIRSQQDLWANLPLGAADLEGRLAQGGELGVDMTVVGRYATDNGIFRTTDLQGDCGGATHVIAALTVGAFEFAASSRAKTSAGVKVMGAGAGGSASSENDLLASDGADTACQTSKREDKEPPHDCDAPIRVEVLGIRKPGDPVARRDALDHFVKNARATVDHLQTSLREWRSKVATTCPQSGHWPDVLRELEENLAGLQKIDGELAAAASADPVDDAAEARANAAKEQTYRAQARAALLKETVGGVTECASPGHLHLTIDDGASAELAPTKRMVVLDGNPVYSRADDSARAGKTSSSVEVYDGTLDAGDHKLAVLFEYRAAPPGKKGATVKLQSSLPFRIESQKATTLAVRTLDGGRRVPLEQRLGASFELGGDTGKRTERGQTQSVTTRDP